MVSGIEGVGEAVTGGLLGAAVEPRTGEGGARRGGNCLNCGTELAGEYCHHCGQQGHVHRTLKGFGHDLMHGVFHFEGKIWRTLPLLAWRPGELTRRYIAGERARFVSPIALFLFSVFLMFAIFSLTGGPFAFDGGSEGNAEARADVEREYRQAEAADRAELGRLQTERGRLAQSGQPVAQVDARIAAVRRQMTIREQVFRRVTAAVASPPDEERRRPGREAPADQEDAEGPGQDLDVNTRLPWLDEAVRHAAENPSLLAYKLQTNAYKFSWALIPISVPFLWLLFLHRRRYRQYKAYDHTVFVTYSIAFMSLAVIALSVLGFIGLPDEAIAIAILLIPPIHLYRQLRGAYRLSRFSALWRTAALLVFAFFAAGLFFVLLLALGAFG